MPRPLALFKLLRHPAKFLGLFVTWLYLQLGELSKSLTRTENRSLKLPCRVVRAVGLFHISCSKFPQLLIVILVLSLRKLDLTAE